MGGQSTPQMFLAGGIPTTSSAIAALGLGRDNNTRTIRLRLLPAKSQEKVFERVADACARLRNGLTFERRRLFLQNGLTAGAMGEFYEKYYEMYKDILGSAVAQQVLNLNDETWKSFFELLKAKREGRLPPFIKKIRPIGYWKDRELGGGLRGYLWGLIGMWSSL